MPTLWNEIPILLDADDQLAVIRGLQDGSREAWNMLYEAYCMDVWRYVARLVGNRITEVGDIVQETFLAAAKATRQFDPQRGTLWSWLAGIAHNQTSLYWRHVQRGRRLHQLAEASAGQLRRWLDDGTSIEQLDERRELIDLVRFVLASLSADYATLLTAKYVDQQSLDEMAAQFGGSVEAMKSKLARARREFRRKFEQLSCDTSEVACE